VRNVEERIFGEERAGSVIDLPDSLTGRGGSTLKTVSPVLTTEVGSMNKAWCWAARVGAVVVAAGMRARAGTLVTGRTVSARPRLDRKGV
jgi:hypothetical protein